MSTRRTVPVLLASACLAASGAGPAAARQSDVTLHPSSPTVVAAGADQPTPVSRDAGGALRPAPPVARATPAVPHTTLTRAGDEGLGTLSWALLAAGAASALLGAAYLGARIAGHTPRVRMH
jgi:hypothetical protein